MNKLVPYQAPGVLRPRLAFVAEAPSWEELEKGVPLVGPSGRIFNAMLAQAGLDRSEFLITNVFNEKIPENDISNWTVSLADAKLAGVATDLPPIGSAGFIRTEYRHHLQRLKKELEQWQPTVIVPLGGTALWSLTGQIGITSLRGSVSTATYLVPGKKLVPTFHPAAVMRSWKMFPVVVGDLIRANAEALRGPSISLPKRELLLEPTLEDIGTYLPRLLQSDLLSVDIETGWGQIKSIGFAPDAEHAICIPFIDKRTANRNYWWAAMDELRAWQMVREALASPVPKLGQNFATYDAFWLLEQHHIAVRNLQHDTRLLHHSLYPELPKDLEFMGNSYATQGAWKGWARNDDKRDA